MRYAHFAKICEKCGKVPNMRQSHIRVFLTYLIKRSSTFSGAPMKKISRWFEGLKIYFLIFVASLVATIRDYSNLNTYICIVPWDNATDDNSGRERRPSCRTSDACPCWLYLGTDGVISPCRWRHYTCTSPPRWLRAKTSRRLSPVAEAQRSHLPSPQSSACNQCAKSGGSDSPKVRGTRKTCKIYGPEVGPINKLRWFSTVHWKWAYTNSAFHHSGVSKCFGKGKR